MNADEDRRQERLQLLDDHIGRSLRQSEAAGELRTAASYGCRCRSATATTKRRTR